MTAPGTRGHLRASAALIRDVAYVMLGKYGQYLVTLVTLPLAARILGAHGVGLLAIGMAAYFIGSVLVDLGITSMVAAMVSHEDVNQLRGNYAAVRLPTLATMTVALLGALAMHVPENLAMVLFGLFAGGLWSISEDWLLIGEGRFGASTAYQTIGRGAYLVLLLILLPALPSAFTAMGCLCLSSVVTAVLTWWDSIRRYGRPKRPSGTGRLLRLGFPVLGSRLLTAGYGQGAPAVYAGVLSAASLGLFSASDRIVRAIQSMLDPIGFTLLPRMARWDGSAGFWRRAYVGLACCVVLAVVVVAVIWVSAPLLISVIFGDEFAAAVPLLRLEIFILPATALTSYVVTAVLPVRQDSLGILTGAVLGTAVAAVALVIAMRTQSVWALVVGTLAAEFTVAAWYLTRMSWLMLRDRTAPTPTRPLIEPDPVAGRVI